MSLATRCSTCGTVFRVVQDQLKVSQGWVRCGHCQAVFNGQAALFELPPAPASPPRRLAPALKPKVTANGDAPLALPTPELPPALPPSPQAADISEPKARPEDPVPVYNMALPPHTQAPKTIWTPAPRLPTAFADTAPDTEAPGPEPSTLPEPPAQAPSVAAPIPGRAPVTDAFPEVIGVAANRGESLPAATRWVPPSVPGQPHARSPEAAPDTTRPPEQPVTEPVTADLAATDNPEASPADSPWAAAGATPIAAPPPAPETSAHNAPPLSDFDETVATPAVPWWDDIEPAPERLAGSPATITQVVAPEPWPSSKDAAQPLEVTAPAEPAARPEFVRRADRAALWRRPAVRAGMISACVLLACTLFAQVAWRWREVFAVRAPALRHILTSAAAARGQPLHSPRALDRIVLDASDLGRTGSPSVLRLVADLRNTAPHPVRAPALDISFSDAEGTLLVRRVFLPAELGLPQEELGAEAQWAVDARLDVGKLRVAGYKIDVFYP